VLVSGYDRIGSQLHERQRDPLALTRRARTAVSPDIDDRERFEIDGCCVALSWWFMTELTCTSGMIDASR
jgi:hypothetical protein